MLKEKKKIAKMENLEKLNFSFKKKLFIVFSLETKEPEKNL